MGSAFRTPFVGLVAASSSMWGDRISDRPAHREARRRAALFRERAKAIVVEIAKPRTRDAERLQ